MPETDAAPPTENLAAFKTLLRRIFQYGTQEVADLDFGIYRVLRQKRDDIERFIEEDLVEAVREGLAAYEQTQAGDLEQRFEKAKAALLDMSDDAILPDGSVREDFVGLGLTPVEDYRAARETRGDASMAASTERRIYDDLTTFFRRYYEDGDFATKRRFAARKEPYYVPYDGQEVFLHWANREQYYVKTTEHFTDYRFDVRGRGLSVHFELVAAEAPQDNVKASDDRYFVLAGGAGTDDRTNGRAPVEVAESDGGDAPATCTIRLAYRPISEGEKEALVDRYNQEAGESKSRLQRRMLCTALEARILDSLADTDAPASVRAALADPLEGDAAEDGEERSPLFRHLRKYTAKNTADYFVHKDLRGFLEGQLAFFIQNEVLELDDVLASGGEVLQQAVSRAQVVRTVGERIIGFLAQIEDFQKRLFEKKKFVTETGYCVTLGQVPESLYDAVLGNDDQLGEWRDLYRMDEWDETLEWRGDFDRAFLESHPHVMIDTRHFDAAFTDRLTGHLSTLGGADGLDGAVDGLCIEGDNFQALNLLQEKYRAQVPCIYIDPPYNTGGDGFLYKDRYQHSSWLSMMADRLTLARELMPADGALFSSIDDDEQENLRHLMSQVFGAENFVANVIWQKKYSPQNDATWFSDDHDFVLTYAKDKEVWRPDRLPRTEEQNDAYSNPDNDERGPWKSSDYTSNKTAEERPNLYYAVENPNTGEEIWPSRDRVWAYSQEYHERNVEEDRIWWGADGTNSVPAYKRFLSEMEGIVPRTVWTYEKAGHNQDAVREMQDLFGENPFASPKPTKLMKRVLQVGPGEPVMDFFAGSGTLGHAVIDLSREADGNEDNDRRTYILNEMGEHFDNVLLPRLKKVVFSSDWKDGVPQGRDGQPHVIKYHRLESYEDALNNIEVTPPEGEQRALLGGFDDYELHYMLPHETRESETLLAPGAFEKPFDYSLRLRHGMASPEARPVDLVATFNYLIGLRLRSRRAHEHQGRRYVVIAGTVEEERGLEKVMVVWRNRDGLDLDEEQAWAESDALPPASDFDRLYVNGPSHLPGAEPTEATFRRRMDPAAS